MSAHGVGARGTDDPDDGDAEGPGGETKDRSLAAFASRDSIGVEAVKADRHPWAALVRTIDSLASRHRHSGDDARRSGVTSACLTRSSRVQRCVIVVTKSSADSSFSTTSRSRRQF